jgi:hypothetical protein
MNRTFLVSRPHRSTLTPASRSLTASTSRSGGDRRVGTQCLRFPPRHAPSRDLGGLRPRSPNRHSPSHVPCKSRGSGLRRLYAWHRLANTRAPTRLIPRGKLHTRLRSRLTFRRLNDDARPEPRLGRALLERLPDPTWRNLVAPFPIADHCGHQPTHDQDRFSACPVGGRWRPAILHLSHSTAYVRGPLHGPFVSARDARLRGLLYCRPTPMPGAHADRRPHGRVLLRLERSVLGIRSFSGCSMGRTARKSA